MTPAATLARTLFPALSDAIAGACVVEVEWAGAPGAPEPLSVEEVARVNLSGYSKAVTSLLIDMEQTVTHVDSAMLARHLTESIGHADIVPLHSREVEHVAFVVLKSPDIPSVLVETAFISDRSEERLLRTPTFRQGMAEALLGGIKEYFRKHAPPGTVLDARNRASGLAIS